MSLISKLKGDDETDTESVTEPTLEFARDPEPGERPSRGRKATSVKAVPVTPSKAQVTKMAKEVADDLAGLLDMGATLWALAGDECCAPILEEQAKPISDALVACLSRNPRLLARLATTDIISMTVQFTGLYKALKPLAVTVYHNHISKAVDDEGDGSGVSRDGVVNLRQYPAFSA